MLKRARYVLSYDTRDPSNRLTCSILSELGYRRSEIIRALLEDVTTRYGTDVLRKENAEVLLYLLHNQIGGTQERTGGVVALAAFPEQEEKSKRSDRKEKSKKEKQRPVTEQKQEAAPVRSEGAEEPRQERRSAPRQQVRTTQEPSGLDDADQKRVEILNYLENGFYEEKEGK